MKAGYELGQDHMIHLETLIGSRVAGATAPPPELSVPDFSLSLQRNISDFLLGGS